MRDENCYLCSACLAERISAHYTWNDLGRSLIRTIRNIAFHWFVTRTILEQVHPSRLYILAADSNFVLYRNFDATLDFS